MSEDPLALSKITAAPPAETDYEAICAAVMETERGRWFLTEYARRNRHADTNVILSAIERIEAAIRGEEVSPVSDHLRLDLLDMAEVIARTEAEMAAIKPEPRPSGNPGEAAQRKASTAAEVLAAAERVLDIVWALREREADSELCDALQAAASEIHAAGERQDFTALRADKAMQVLRHLEGRINALIGVWGATPAKAGASGAADTAEHEPADIGVAAVDRADIAEPEARHDSEPEVRGPLELDLDSLMPPDVAREPQAEANVQAEARVDVGTAAERPIEEANLIDEAAAKIAAAPESAAASQEAVDHQAESGPARETLDAPAEPATMASDPASEAKPLTVDADTSIVLAASRPPIFVVFQASETPAEETAPDAPTSPAAPDALPAQPASESDIEAASAPAMLEPVEATVEDLTTADPTNDTVEQPIEPHVAPLSEFAPEPEPKPFASEPDEAAAEAAADAVVEAVAQAMTEAVVEAETASAVAEIEAAHHANAGGGADHDLTMPAEPTQAVEEQCVATATPTEDVIEAPSVASPDQNREPPTAEIATEPEIEIAAEPDVETTAEPEIEIAAVEADVPMDLDTRPAQPSKNPDAPLPTGTTPPNAADDIELLLEPLPSRDAPAPKAAIPAEQVTALTPEAFAPAPESAAPTPEPAAPVPEPAALLPEPDEDPADLFEMLPEPKPVEAEISAPSLAAAPAAAESNEASVDAAIAASAATIPEPTFAEAPIASAVAQAETAPDAAAVAAPASAAPQRLAPRQIQTPRVTPNDPMAAVRALSEDELIALFS